MRLQNMACSVRALLTVPLSLFLSSCAQDGEHPSDPPQHSVWILVIPTLFDLIATALMNVGLLTVTASVYQACQTAHRSPTGLVRAMDA